MSHRAKAAGRVYFTALIGLDDVMAVQSFLHQTRRAQRWPRAIVVGLLLSAWTAGVPAADNEATTPQTYTFLFENDLFGDRDAQYTNGLKVSWLSGDLHRLENRPEVPPWLLGLVQKLNAFERRLTADDRRQFNFGFAVGQQMFTPDDIQTSSLVVDDRPYAGWLYGALSFVSKTSRVADTIEFQGGVIGPASLAQQAQDLVHEIRDIPKARGWGKQLDTEPGFVIFYERKWRLQRMMFVDDLGYDFITHAGLALGNVYDYGAAGGELRFGWKLPDDFGTSLIRPGGDANAPTASSTRVRGLGVYGFAAVSGRLVGRNIFLDGNSFGDSHSVDKKLLVGDLIVGASLVYRSAKLSYAQVFRTKEFDGQRGTHNFGSISLSLSF
ncbi:MAG: lipid A deacylase LpxR family protein [Gammaproteobacteria bacterium]